MDKLIFLDQAGERILVCATDGSGLRTLVADCPRHPDGIAIDEEAGHIYWTNMGLDFKRNDGSIERANLDGSGRRTIVAEGQTFTAKQILVDKPTGHLYWCDREGMRVMRAALDGSGIEVLVQTGAGEQDRLDATNWCVGIAIDHARGMLYWTQKGPSSGGAGRILRAPLALPAGVTPATRSDIEVVFERLPEPVDLEWAPNGALLWTDRARQPRGGSVERAEPGAGQAPQVLADGLGEAIGIAVDHVGGRMYVTTLQGKVVSMKLDGSERKTIVENAGRLTGICYHRTYG